MTDLTAAGFNPAAHLPESTAVVPSEKTAATIGALLDGIKACGERAATFDPYSAQQLGEAAAHLARALDLVSDFGAR